MLILIGNVANITNSSENISLKVQIFLRIENLFSGQKLEAHHNLKIIQYESEAPLELSFMEKYRKYIGFLIPFSFMHVVWWTLAIRYNLFHLYSTHFEMPLTMILGATVAGMAVVRCVRL